MAHLSGQHGRLYIKNDNIGQRGDDIEIAKVRDWSVNMQHQPLDTTTLGDTDRTLMQGLRSYSASGTLLFYDADRNTNFGLMIKNTFKRVLLENGVNEFWGRQAAAPQMVRIMLALVDGPYDDEDEIQMLGYITAFNVTCAVGEVVQGTFTFEGHGAPTAIDFK